MMTFFVYILRTSLNTLYIGQTNNLERRLKEHQGKGVRSARYIRCFQKAELVYSEEQPTRGEAMKRERELRSWPKKKKEKLVAGELK
jgi:putative endonuclease